MSAPWRGRGAFDQRPAESTPILRRYPMTALSSADATRHEGRRDPEGVVDKDVAVVIEDGEDIRELLAQVLTQAGFTVHAASDGVTGVDLVRRHDPVVVTIDVNMPGIDGFEAARQIRNSSSAYIVMITARGDEIDTLQGLQTGADDYIVKPFVFDELLARLQVHLLRRREADTPRTVFTAGRLTLDVNIRQVSFGEASARLTPREAELLALLMQEVNRPISRGEIFDRLWASQGGLSLNVVDVYVGYLRSKLSDFVRLGGPVIVTVRGKGFMLDLRGQDFRH